MPVIEVLFDSSGNAVGARRVEGTSVIQSVKDASSLLGAAKAIIQGNANQFKGVTIDNAYANYVIRTSPALTEEQRAEAFRVLSEFEVGDRFAFKTVAGPAIESVGDRPPPPLELIQLFLDP